LHLLFTLVFFFWGGGTSFFVFCLIGRFVYSFRIFRKNSGKITSCAAPCSGG
jgi:hypothetical protein